MSNSTPTPGPWVIDAAFFPNRIRQEGTGLHVASNVDDGDARLISAAPDLLAACKAALECHDGANFEVSPASAPWFQRVDAVLRAAIAKAEGA